MRIVFIGQKGIPAKSGGVEKHAESLALALTALGQEVIVYNRRNYLPDNLAGYRGIKLISLPFINNKNLASITHNFLATLDAVRRRPAIAHYHGIGPSLCIWLLKLLRPKTKVVATLHSFDYNNDKWSPFAKKMLKLGEKLMFKTADAVIVLTNNIADYARGKYQKKLIAVIPNGVNIHDYPGDDLLKTWNLTAKNYLLSVSRLIKLKGIQHLITAYRNIKTDKKLVIVGDGEYEDELRQLAAGDERIIFAGNQTGKYLKQLFANAYLFTQTSRMEGLSISLMEAMSYGLPCFVSDITANLEIGQDKVFTFKSENVTDLQTKLQAVLAHEEIELKKLGEAGKKRVKEKYDHQAVAQATLNLYQKLLNQ